MFQDIRSSETQEFLEWFKTVLVRQWMAFYSVFIDNPLRMCNMYIYLLESPNCVSLVRYSQTQMMLVPMTAIEIQVLYM